jgi:PAS domain S-box-containing protein
MKLRILVVNEDDSAARSVAARLAALGHDVVAIVPSAGVAIDAAASTLPGLLLMDVPDGDGSNAAAAARRILRRHSIPAVFTGTPEREEVLQQAALTEPFSYLVPPFSDRELDLSIELAISRHGTARTSHELQGFFDVSIDMFCFLGFDGYFRRLNTAWERTLGFTREELMSRRFIEFVHPDDRERTLNQNAYVRAGGQARAFENRYVCRDGSYRWFLWNATPMVAEGVIYSVARDITERRNAEQERVELVRRLEKSLAEVRTLQEILPICMYCRKIRDDEDYWLTVESYIARHTRTRFSHAICPNCMTTEVEPELWDI